MQQTETKQPQPTESIITKTWHEISQPFIDLIHAPRALWGINLAYMLEGLSYFGILTYLAIHFSDYIFKGVEHADVWSHQMVMVLTAGIAITMVILGFIPDKIGVRRALILAFVFLLIGRSIMSSAPTVFGLQPAGLWSWLHILTLAGIIIVTMGYGMYQPAAYAAVRQFTTPKTASMGYAMLYALMNGGSSLAMLSFLVRDEAFLGLGITGTFWVYTGVTLISLMATVFILSKRTVANAIERAKLEASKIQPEQQEQNIKSNEEIKSNYRIPLSMWIMLAGIIIGVYLRVPIPYSYMIIVFLLLLPLAVWMLPSKFKQRTLHAISTHPLSNLKFFVFIFALMPVQTLFTYNWLILPQYISRAYEGWIGEYYEFASNLNPILIFIFVPIFTALTYKKNVYNMMIVGTLIMGSSAFILAFGASPFTLFAYILVMTIGEAIWSARFLQYVTEIAPEGQAGQYQGVAQLPWFLTKFLVPLLYSGAMMERYCPAEGVKDTGMMWLIFGLIAIASPIILWLTRNWMIKGSSDTK